MNQASLYRDDSSVTATLRSSRPGSFYAGHDRTFVNGGAMSATPFDPQQRGDVTTTNTKIDQLMNMVSSTQQLLFSQQYLRDIKAWDQQCSIRVRIIRILGHAHRTLL